MKIEEHPAFKRSSILRYEGIGPNKYKNVMEYDAFDYAMHECGVQINPYRTLDPEFKKMLVEWYFSGNWIEVREGE